MRLAWLAWGLALVVVCPIACGGSSFTTASGDDGGSPGGDGSGSSSGAASDSGGGPDSSPSSDAGGTGEGGSVEGGTADGGPAGPPVRCGPLTCTPDTPICCFGATGASCAHQECGCNTQLECASDADCALPTAVCCIADVQDATCASKHFVARCAGACLGGASHLCDPNAQKPQCLASQCSTDGGDLQNVGLPSNNGYGVCK